MLCGGEAVFGTAVGTVPDGSTDAAGEVVTEGAGSRRENSTGSKGPKRSDLEPGGLKCDVLAERNHLGGS